MSQVQTQNHMAAADIAKVIAAAALVVGGVVAFYLLKATGEWRAWSALLVLMGLAGVAFFTSLPGIGLMAFGRESVREVKKVVWPARQEATTMTAYVFIFVVVMAVILWLTDKTLEWLLYSVILGWKK
jgi:preprotein translocase subunit SecE